MTDRTCTLFVKMFFKVWRDFLHVFCSNLTIRSLLLLQEMFQMTKSTKSVYCFTLLVLNISIKCMHAFLFAKWKNAMLLQLLVKGMQCKQTSKPKYIWRCCFVCVFLWRGWGGEFTGIPNLLHQSNIVAKLWERWTSFS